MKRALDFKKTGALPLLGIAILSVLLFGAVEAWSFAIVGGLTVLLFNIAIYRDEGIAIAKENKWASFMTWAAAGFLLLCLLQIVPIPLRIFKALSPAGYEIMSRLSTGRCGWLSISISRFDTLYGFLKFTVYVMIFLISFSAARDGDGMDLLLSGLSGFGFLLAVFALVQNSAWNGRIYWFRDLTQGGSPFGPFVNRNHFAGFEGMVVPLGLGIALEKAKMEKLLFYFFMPVVTGVGIFFSLSRGGIISFLLSIMCFLAFAASGRFRGKAFFYVLLFLTAVLSYLLYLGVSPVIDRFAADGLSGESRLPVWEAAFREFLDFKWFGTGIGTFHDIFPVFNPGSRQLFYYAHNDYLNLLLETGLAGAFLAGMFVLSLAVMTAGCYSRRKRPYILAGLASSVFYMMVHSFFDFNLHIPSNAITFSVILGALAGFSTGKNGGAVNGRVY
ncbi:MAG: O-antigen ligase family protein [Nitrospiraceae bacterium]|nr:O-antigen ligase family protein [Nitrospiraceae bacterium]